MENESFTANAVPSMSVLQRVRLPCGMPDLHCAPMNDGQSGYSGYSGFSDLPLFARHSDPDTSHQSMREYDRDRMRNAERFVISLYARHGELADFQLKQFFDVGWKQPCSFHLYRQARSVARDHGKIVDTGKRIINPETKRHQVVWAYNEGTPIQIKTCPTCGHVLRRQ